MKNKTTVVCLILILLSATLLASCSGEKAQEKYTVYFGLNDATSGKQELTLEEASEQIRAIFVSKGLGYTEFVALGAYTENGESKENDTLVYMFFFCTEEQVNEIVSQAKEELNLASVLIDKEMSEYYLNDNQD